jgi:hypothetical protein
MGWRFRRPGPNQRIKIMTALPALGRVFDVTVAIAFVLISLTVAGATAVVGV